MVRRLFKPAPKLASSSVIFLVVAMVFLLVFTTAQNRSSLIAKLRRRGSSLIGRATGEHLDNTNDQGLRYSSDHPISFRSDFHRNDYLPGLPYWRLDNDMPGVTRADRFRGNYQGYEYDYWRGRL